MVVHLSPLSRKPLWPPMVEPTSIQEDEVDEDEDEEDEDGGGGHEPSSVMSITPDVGSTIGGHDGFLESGDKCTTTSKPLMKIINKSSLSPSPCMLVAW